MEIRKRFFKNTVVLYIAGKIDIDGAPLIEETGRLVKEGITQILCNFSNVEMVDYNGLTIIAIAYKNVVNQGGVLKLCGVPNHVNELFRSARLDEVFDIYSEEENALKSFELSNKVDMMRLRRRFKRIDVNIPVRYKIGLSADAKLQVGKATNVGGEGLFILSKSTYPVATKLYIELQFHPNEKPLTMMCTVIWLADKELQPHSYPGMGVNFASLDKKTQTELIEFIDKNITGRTRA
ncbi:MAG: PilZ domain-containing protein [Candidatus Omnitrophica bacterium]|nr:PilZ domain-containing protein [Candidatus Omnitrophota bacterium]